MTAAIQRMPGAISISRLQVYDTVGPDGQRGGTPHVHLLCSELYFTLSGSGAVEMIDSSGFSCVELRPYSALLFSPGTIHRLINSSGDLQLLVVMQNSGLPERGDNVVCFKPELLETDERFNDAMSVSSLDEAMRRRDRGVEGFLQLKDTFAKSIEEGQAALRHFFELAEQRTASFRTEWTRVVENGAAAEARDSLQRLQALQAADLTYLLQAQHHVYPADEPSQLGFCGHLSRYTDLAVFTPEGIRAL